MKAEAAGDGVPLVLAPGGLTGAVSWKPHAARLAARFRVIRVQPLNVDDGLRRERLPDDYGVGMEVQALAASVEASGVDRAHLAGWSFGAAIALSYAIANPSRVRTLTLIEPPAIWVLRSRGPLSADMLERQRSLAAMWRAEISEEQLAWFTHFAGFVPPAVEPRTLPQWPSWMEHRQSLAHGDAVYLHEDDIGLVRQFGRPVALFKSSESADFLIRIVDILGEEFPEATVHDLPGGHAMHIASMERFLELFREHLDRGG